MCVFLSLSLSLSLSLCVCICTLKIPLSNHIKICSLSHACIAGGISVISPNQLGDYISLVGAMAITALGYIFPAFLHIIVFAGNRTTQGVIEMSSVGKAEASNSDDKDGASSKSTKWQCVYKTLWVCKDAFILLFGVMGCVFGTYAALNELIMDFNKSPVSKECVGSLMATK